MHRKEKWLSKKKSSDKVLPWQHWKENNVEREHYHWMVFWCHQPLYSLYSSLDKVVVKPKRLSKFSISLWQSIMKSLFLIVIELNGKHKENGCQFISYTYLYAKKTQMWLGNTSLQFLFCKDFQSPTERSRASSLSPSLKKKICILLHFSSMTQSLINGFLWTLPDGSRSLA